MGEIVDVGELTQYNHTMMNLTVKSAELARLALKLFDDSGMNDKELVSPLPGLLILRHTHPTSLEATFYEPTICLILQGRKETILGDRVLSFGAGESLIVSHDLPVVTRITETSPDCPYLAMILTLDLGILRSLYDQIGEADLENGRAYAADVHQTDTALIDAMGRYLMLVEKPVEAKVMTPLLLKEIHFRLLMAPHGGMLRQLLLYGSHASGVSRAIQQIRKNFRLPLMVPELAKSVGMSSSSFYQHFKSITATTPLQYQKDLRLLEARRLLLEGKHSVTNAAFEVGYESLTQFSREYSRKFGASPRNDLSPIG